MKYEIFPHGQELLVDFDYNYEYYSYNLPFYNVQIFSKIK